MRRGVRVDVIFFSVLISFALLAVAWIAWGQEPTPPCDQQLVVAAQYAQQIRDVRDQYEYLLAQERAKVIGLTKALKDKPPVRDPATGITPMKKDAP